MNDFCTENIHIGADRAEAIRAHGIPLSAATRIVLHFIPSLASHKTYFPPIKQRIKTEVKALSQEASDLEEWKLSIITSDARHGAVAVLEAIEILLSRAK